VLVIAARSHRSLVAPATPRISIQEVLAELDRLGAALASTEPVRPLLGVCVGLRACDHDELSESLAD